MSNRPPQFGYFKSHPWTVYISFKFHRGGKVWLNIGRNKHETMIEPCSRSEKTWFIHSTFPILMSYMTPDFTRVYYQFSNIIMHYVKVCGRRHLEMSKDYLGSLIYCKLHEDTVLTLKSIFLQERHPPDVRPPPPPQS